MSNEASDEGAYLSEIADIVFEEIGADTDILSLSRQRQVFLAVYSAQPVIDNGGFRYFFESDWPGNPPYSFFSGAYREIGATNVADWIEQAASMFGVPDPHLNPVAREYYLDKYCDDDGNELIVLGDKSIRESPRVFNFLANYVRLHAAEFRPPTPGGS